VLGLTVSRRGCLIGAVALGACNAPTTPLANSQGLGIAIVLPNGGMARLSTFRLGETRIDQIARPVSVGVSKAGDYSPGSASPIFAQINAEAALAEYQKDHGEAAQALINCSFFERYDPVTELSFPIKRVGRLLTGGSSPYGPRPHPADPRYASVGLKALVWNDTTRKILNYDPTTGEPLKDPNFADGLVTYRYEDHPATILAGDPVGQYQLLGIRRDQTLLVLSITQGRMMEGAAVLRVNGAVGDILTLDGGPSTHLWTKTNGTVIATKSIALPHYLGFRSAT
jgi:hypothetical protein